MELNLHAMATQCFVSGRAFAEGDRVVSYLVRPSTGSGPRGGESPAIARYDLLESEDPPPQLPSVESRDIALRPEGTGPMEWAFVYCRWVTVFRPRAADDNPDRALKLTAENLFLSLAPPAGASPAEGEITDNAGINTPLLQFLALMLERKKLIKLRGLTEDRQRRIYEHMPSHQLYEVPDDTLDDGFFLRIQEHLGVLVGTPKTKTAPAESSQTEPQPTTAQ